MEERLQELKEKITSFVNDYDVKNFYVDINEDIDLVVYNVYCVFKKEGRSVTEGPFF